MDFDLVVCADGYRSTGRALIDPDATPRYRGMVLWRGLLDGGTGLRVGYRGGHGIVYYIPGPEQGGRLVMWGYYLQVPEDSLASVLVDDQERRQSGSVPVGKVHPDVRDALESRLAELLPPRLFELVRRCGNSSVQAVYSMAARGYVRDRVCLVGDAGTVLPPFAGSGVLRAVASATSLVEALAGASTVDDALRGWGQSQVRVAARAMPVAEQVERVAVFDMPDLAAMTTVATNDWMSTVYSGFEVTLPAAVRP